MSNLKAFFAENVVKSGSEFVAISDRFKDENGSPIQWELKAVSADVEETIRRDSTKRIQNGNKIEEKFDSNDYIRKMIVECVIFPNLDDAELQDSYGVKNPEKLLQKMLVSGEYMHLMKKVTEINKLNETFDDKVEEAKN